MSSRAATATAAAVAAVLAGFVSVLRVVAGNDAALSTLVWAEDGLFPLCSRAHGPLACLVEPYSGYLLLLPRIVAWPVGAFPLDAWPLVTNVAAGILAALLAALTVLVLRAGGSGVIGAALIAVLPVIAPVVGFEAINVAASVYMPLMFVAALAVCFPPWGRFPTTAFAVGALVTALTIPSSAILLLPLAVQAWRRRVPRRSAAILAAAMVVGLAAQLWATIATPNPRSVEWSLEAARSWFDGVPVAFLGWVPGQVNLAFNGAFEATSLSLPSAIGLLTGAVVVLGIVLTPLRGAVASGIGMLLVTGALVGVIPAAARFANNRYFVITVLLWTAALLIAVDRWTPARRELVMGIVAVVVAAACVPMFAASAKRTYAEPPWPDMLASVRASCATDQNAPAVVMFTPSWPFADAQFPGPTSNVVPCEVVE